MKLVIVDFDGTLRHTNTSPPEDFLPGKSNRFEQWMLTRDSLKGKDIPTIIKLIKGFALEKARLVLVTRRPLKSRPNVLKVIEGMGIKFFSQYFGVQDKAEIVKTLLERYRQTTEITVIDDSPAILKAISSIIPSHVKSYLLQPPEKLKDSSQVAEETKQTNPLTSAGKIFKKLEMLGVEQVIVGYSGGKDSLATLDLCVKRFGAENVKVFFLYTLPNLECESALLNVPEQRYGIKPILLPLPSIMDMIRNGYARYTPPSLQELLDRKYGWNEVEKIVRYKTGLRWICYGHRMQDSLQRRGMLTRCNGVWEASYTGNKLIQRAYPLMHWNHKAVFAYLKKHHLPIPHMFGAGEINTSGLSLVDPDVLAYVKQHYPNDYQRLKKVFPRLDTPIFRQEVLQRAFAKMDEDPAEKKAASPMQLQQTSDMFETELAKILGLKKTKKNYPVDWIAPADAHGGTVGIELKVLNKAEDEQARIQMRPSARKRKEAWLLEERNRQGFTILIDNRDNYANGAYEQFYSGHRLYYMSGFGANRLSSLTKAASLSHLLRRIWPGIDRGLGDVDKKFEELLRRTYG